MDLNYLRKILKIFDQSSLTDLTIEEENVKISLSRKPPPSMDSISLVKNLHPETIPTLKIEPSPENKEKLPEPEEQKPSIATTYHKINSPIVGTFYRAPSPGADPFVEVGTHVVPGQTLCIVEAMKVMNEIESDVSGTIVEILVENGKPVEYNQTLMLVKPD
ncbi:MAG: acetyl-CoA carboxylase biotin carboxyl carrier protein [Ignavibacteria bacterium]|nr:acetyl-CoA carboxylase biotin carboxyl carrier protein [Ignavibacteria bacterium]